MAPFEDKEKRKVQLSGKSSCMVTLPKKWVREMGLHQGSEITIMRASTKSLLITLEGTPITSERRREALIQATAAQSTESIVRKIISLYVLGYNLINIKSISSPFSLPQRTAIKLIVRRYLIGTEIVVDTNDAILLQVLLSYSGLSVENALKRMHLISSSMQRDALSILTSLDKDTARSVAERDDEIDRFRLFVTRQLNASVDQGIFKEIGFESRDLLGYSQIVSKVEKVADNAERIAREAWYFQTPLEKGLSEMISAFSEFALVLVDMALLSLFKRDYRAADRVLEEMKSLPRFKNDILVLLKDGTKKDSSDHIVAIANYLEDSARYAGDIAKIVLDLTVEKANQKELNVALNEPLVAD